MEIPNIWKELAVKRKISSRNKFSRVCERDLVETSLIKGITSMVLVELLSIVLKRIDLSYVFIYFGVFCPFVIRREYCKK